jgi:hypothetical protein
VDCLGCLSIYVICNPSINLSITCDIPRYHGITRHSICDLIASASTTLPPLLLSTDRSWCPPLPRTRTSIMRTLSPQRLPSPARCPPHRRRSRCQGRHRCAGACPRRRGGPRDRACHRSQSGAQGRSGARPRQPRGEGEWRG